MNDTTVIYIGDEGGYLVPEYIWTKVGGTRALVMRTAGSIFNRQDWYKKGMERHNFAGELVEILRRKENIQAKIELSK